MVQAPKFDDIVDPDAALGPRGSGAWLPDPRHRVTGLNPSFAGQAIVGEALDLLTDISGRYAFARRKVVIERLHALTAAWRALHASTDLHAELLGAEVAQRDAEARDRARLLTERLDEAAGRSATEEGTG